MEIKIRGKPVRRKGEEEQWWRAVALEDNHKPLENLEGKSVTMEKEKCQD